MRFLSFHRRFELQTRPSRFQGKYGHAKQCIFLNDGSSVSRLLRTVALICVLFSVGSAFGQPPGTTPTRDVFPQQKDGIDANGLPIRAFMFLSESDNVVLMPGLSWEEFERFCQILIRPWIQISSCSATSHWTLKGDADTKRFEGEVVRCVFVVTPSQGQWVRIPLQMGNFHRLEEPQVIRSRRFFHDTHP